MIVLVLVVRDEADIVESMLDFHLSTGVDHVIATDHRSVDGTTEILRRFEREGRLTYVRDDRPTISQAVVVTGMACRAATELRADWVMPADADELWWCREGSLPDVLADVPRRYGVVLGVWRHFVLRPDDPRPFHERLTIRTRPAPEWESVYHAHRKVVFRGDPSAVVAVGNHSVAGVPGGVLHGWYPIEVLHFPARSPEQVAHKFGPRAAQGFSVVGHHKRAAADAPVDELLASLCPAGDELRDALVRRDLVHDVRARDAIRAIRAGRPVECRPPTVDEDLEFAREVDFTFRHDGSALLRARRAAFERRLAVRGAAP